MKTTIILILFGFLLINRLSAQDFVFSAQTDLNADNKPETIKLETTKDPNGFKLSVNDKTLMNKFGNGEPDGFRIVDIDKQDKYREIAVHTPGPSDDNEFMIYWFNGEQLTLLDHFDGWLVFNGNGIVYVENWVGFWKSRDKYEIDKDKRKLHFVEQFAYYVGIKAKVKKSFPIYKETGLINKVAVLSEGSEIELLLCDKTNREYFDYRYLIKSESGLTGWADFQKIWDNTEGLPVAD